MIDHDLKHIAALGGSQHESPLAIAMEEEFQREVLHKLGALEAKMDMLVGSSQPGRVRLIEERVQVLERNDIRRGVYDRLLNAAIATIVSAAIALHDHLFRR